MRQPYFSADLDQMSKMVMDGMNVGTTFLWLITAIQAVTPMSSNSANISIGFSNNKYSS